MTPEVTLVVIRILVMFVLFTLHTLWVVSTFRPFDQVKASGALTSYVCMMVVYYLILYDTLR